MKNRRLPLDKQDGIYNSYLNRWSQPDTIVPNLYNPQSLNRYSYVYNNPVNFTDPTGYTPICLDDWCQNIPPAVGVPSSGGGGGNGNGNSTGNASGAAGEDLDAGNEDTSCGSYPGHGGGCTESFRDIQAQTTNNVLSAFEICQSPYANDFEKGLACGYLIAWGIPITLAVTAGGIALFGSWQAIAAAGTAVCMDGDCGNEVQTGSNIVYQGWKNGERYIGITKNWVARQRYWVNQDMDIQRIPGLGNLSRIDARAVEQYLIEHYGLNNLANQINSIAVSNKIYASSIARAQEIMRIIGWGP